MAFTPRWNKPFWANTPMDVANNAKESAQTFFAILNFAILLIY